MKSGGGDNRALRHELDELVPVGLRVRWSGALAEGLTSGLPLSVVGQLSLPAPLARVLVFARSGAAPDGKGALAAALIPAGIRPLPEPDLGGRFKTRRRRALIVLDESGQDQFVVTAGLLNPAVLACGRWPVLVPLIAPAAPAFAVSDRHQVEAALTRFCEVLEALVTGYYQRTGKKAPVLEVTLAPTRISVETALKQLRSLGKSAVELASKVPRGTRPGRIYEPPEGDDTEEVTFADVGGQDAAKEQLEAICQAIKEPATYRKWGVRPPRGVLLFGPPGTGKTLLARCLARESGARFIHVRATDVTSKWYGEAEKNLQQAFDWARKEAPAVIFFDEIDALGRSRMESHEASHRLVSTFLENMDGLEGSEGVVVLAATNRPEAVDEALTRPGRFDRLVEVPLPSRDGRRAIFELHLKKSQRLAGRAVFEPLDEGGWERLLEATEGYSGADIAEAVRRALESKVRSRATGGQISQDELLVHAVSVARPW